MIIRGVEPAVNALRNRLETQLPTEIIDINSGVTDGYTITDPVAVLDYIPPPSMLMNFPIVCIGRVQGHFEDDNGSSATGVYDLAVVTYLQDVDQQALVRRLERYTLAVQRTVMYDRNLGVGTGVPWSVKLERVDYGPTLGDDKQPDNWLSWTAVTIQVKIDEE